MRLFITGATGFIGGRLVRRLVTDGHKVVALVRTPSKAADLAALGVQLAKGDITDPASMRAPMVGAEGVFHCAAWYEVGSTNADKAWAINVEGTRNVIATAPGSRSSSHGPPEASERPGARGPCPDGVSARAR